MPYAVATFQKTVAIAVLSMTSVHFAGSCTLQDSNIRMNSGLIRNFVCGARVCSIAVSSTTPAAEGRSCLPIDGNPHRLLAPTPLHPEFYHEHDPQKHIHLHLLGVVNWASAARSVPQGVSSGELPPVHEAWQAEPASVQSAEASILLPSCPEEAVALPGSQLNAVCQPGTPQQSSESAQSRLQSPPPASEEGTAEDAQQAAAETDGWPHATTNAGGCAQRDTQHFQDTGRTGLQSHPGVPAGTGPEAEQHRWMALERPHKSLPADAFTAALKGPAMANASSNQLRRAWQEIEDSSVPEAPCMESNSGSGISLSAQGQLLKSLITQAGSLLRGAGEWGFDTLELAEVRSDPPDGQTCDSVCKTGSLLPPWFKTASSSTESMQSVAGGLNKHGV